MKRETIYCTENGIRKPKTRSWARRHRLDKRTQTPMIVMQWPSFWELQKAYNEWDYYYNLNK